MIVAHRAPEADALPLDEVLDLQAARPLADSLLARRGSDLELDGSGVSRIGGLCLQVLLSAHDTWAADGKTLSLLNPSAAFVDGLNRLGVATQA